MVLARTRRRLRRLRTGFALLVRIYRRDRNLRRLAGSIWFAATRHGLIGLRQWVISVAPVENLGQAPSPADDTIPSDATGAYPLQDPAAKAKDVHQAWLDRYDPLAEAQLQAARRHHAMLDLPDLLILAVISQEDLPSLDRMAASWQESMHSGWQAAIVAAPNLTATGTDALQALAAKDARVSILKAPGEIRALREQYNFMLLSFGGTLLNSLSAYMFLEAATRTGAAVLYSDHDRIATDGARVDPAFKPQFSPEYLARYNYIGDCLLISRVVDWAYEDSAALFDLTLAEFDKLVSRLLLQASAQGQLIEHLPFPLFHVPAQRLRLSHDLPVFAATGPRVSIIIPTRDGLDHLKPCIGSILEKTAYDLDQVEIVIIDNNSVEPETLDYLNEMAALASVTVVKYPAPFNFAEINNVGAAAARGDIFIFLNNDTLVHDAAWLSKLVGYAQQPGVGVVGAKLLFPDGAIQHGGCVAGGSMGTVQHLLSFVRPEDVAATDHTRELSLMTGACLAVCKEVFRDIGGFDPILRITWNDVEFCLSALSAGLRNIYIADPLFIHDESKTRGHDDTRAKYIRYFSEADYTRRRYRDYFYDDPSYNPNLSLERAGELAEPPRVRLPWFRPANQATRILLLSIVYKVGFGVPVVIQQHARKLVEKGYEVVIGGSAAENELSFPGCERVILNSAKEAAIYAFASGVALVVSHTPPFFEVPILIGGHIPVLAYDYGEPSAEFFQDPTRSYLLNVGYQKRGAAALTTTIATISQSVKDETLNKDALVVGLANSHLATWSEDLRPARDRFREKKGWCDGFVVLTVCRFHENERAYKGLDKIADILREFPYLYPKQSKPLIWVLAGAGTPTDVEQAEELGFTVFPNVSDAMLADLYKAADAYMGFSKWEGYNLGISQALAMGLPTLGSDIPAHREFGIVTTNSALIACGWLVREVERHAASKPDQRIAQVYDWDRSAEAFVAVIEDMLRNSAVQKPRAGASGRVWQNFAVTRS
jgi:GT2 family glycosyltransferase